ncbi:MAG: M50 family metallopeptidase [Anaeromyxobacter sp.]
MLINVLSILAAVLGVSALIVLHEAGHFLVARACGMRVERFSVGFGKVLFRFQRGETEFAISALPLGGYVSISGMGVGEEISPDDRTAYCNQAPWRRFAVILAGPFANYALAVVMAAVLLLGVGLSAADPTARVGEVTPGMPAEQAGLQRGDRITSAAGVKVATFAELVTELQRHPGQTITLEVVRGDGPDAQGLAVPITPRDQGGKGRVGFGQATLLTHADGPADAVAQSFDRTHTVLAAQVGAFSQLFSNAANVEGPVGIGKRLFHAAKEGAGPFFTLLWLISAVLALFNLFPIPGLDGARLAFLGYELITRRKVNARVETVIHTVGVLALLGLLALVSLKDIANLLHVGR